MTNTTREQISAFADNELSDGHLDIALASLRQHEGRETWDVYHQIGDALRSDDLNRPLRADFNAKLFARLDAEPTFVAPGKSASRIKGAALRRFAMPGMAAAVALAAFLMVPQLVTRQTTAVVASKAAPSAPTITIASKDGDVLRDPRIDEYLMAHQGVSPSLYSAAQYARSATFAVDSDN